MVSSPVVAPQGSQILGVAPVRNPQTNAFIGVVLTAFYMDEAYIENISQIIDTDIGIVKDNAVIVSTIDETTGYETLINEGWLSNAELPAMNINYSDGGEYRLLGHPLVISETEQGSVLVTQPIDQLFSLNRRIQIILFTVTGVFAMTALWFWIAGLPDLYAPAYSTDRGYNFHQQGRSQPTCDAIVSYVQG